MHSHTVLRIVTKILVAPILIFALYIQFLGDYGPGGGFQAGVIFASAIILYALVFGMRAARRAVPPGLLRVTAGLGILIYAGTGVATMFLGGNLLGYDQLAHSPEHGQELGLGLIEFGVGLTVMSVVTSIFYVFAGRGRKDRDP